MSKKAKLIKVFSIDGSETFLANSFRQPDLSDRSYFLISMGSKHESEIVIWPKLF